MTPSRRPATPLLRRLLARDRAGAARPEPPASKSPASKSPARKSPGPEPVVPEPAVPGTVVVSGRGLGLRVGPRWLLRDVSLDLVAGRVTAVIGPNGAGKSTLLALLAGDITPSAGSVRLGGLPVERLHPARLARRRAVLPQQPRLSFPFTVSEVVAMGRAPWAGTSAEDGDEQAVAGALAVTDMTEFAGRRFPTLSGGEQARSAFARVLAQGTGVLLLDEPTAALDLRHAEQVMTVVRERADRGQAVLTVLHDIGLAAAYADEVAVLHDGRLAAAGRPADVLTESLLGQVYGLPVDVFPHPAHGGPVITPRRPAGRAAASRAPLPNPQPPESQPPDPRSPEPEPPDSEPQGSQPPGLAPQDQPSPLTERTLS